MACRDAAILVAEGRRHRQQLLDHIKPFGRTTKDCILPDRVRDLGVAHGYLWVVIVTHGQSHYTSYVRLEKLDFYINWLRMHDIDITIEYMRLKTNNEESYIISFEYKIVSSTRHCVRKSHESTYSNLHSTDANYVRQSCWLHARYCHDDQTLYQRHHLRFATTCDLCEEFVWTNRPT